jgi:ABC-type multidrug transport system fused ATPase/permease subunit
MGESAPVSGVLLTKIFGRQAAETARYAAQNERLTALQICQQMIKQGFSIVVVTFFSLTPRLIYLVAGFAHDVSPGTLVAFTSLQFQLFTPALAAAGHRDGGLQLAGAVPPRVRLPGPDTRHHGQPHRRSPADSCPRRGSAGRRVVQLRRRSTDVTEWFDQRQPVGSPSTGGRCWGCLF